MSKLTEYKFESTYELADLIDSAVNNEIQLWNYNEDYFISASCKFSKETLLHQYIVCEALNYHSRYFIKNGDVIDDEILDEWYALFKTYNIEIKVFESEDENQDISKWFEENEKSFIDLFDKMAEEVFYVLFANRNFLLKFNNLITKTVKETEYPKDCLNEKGRIKRTTIPQWVKRAVFMRDKGRCVFCNTDLTNLTNGYVSANYDHMVPLDKYGVNDPCNIQLSCEKCNKSKTNKDGTTTNNYFTWW